MDTESDLVCFCREFNAWILVGKRGDSKILQSLDEFVEGWLLEGRLKMETLERKTLEKLCL